MASKQTRTRKPRRDQRPNGFGVEKPLPKGLVERAAERAGVADRCSVHRGDLLTYRDDVEGAIGDVLDLLSAMGPLALDEAYVESIVGALVKLRATHNWLGSEARGAS